MKVGLSLGDLRTIAVDARRAEANGFDYVACGEHAYFYGPTPNAFIGLAAAAGATTRIRLVSTISLAPQYPAALFAKLVSTLDVASSGRFEIGIGAGGEYPPEFEAVGVDPATRFRRIDETMTVLRLLFSGEPVDFDGEFTPPARHPPATPTGAGPGAAHLDGGPTVGRDPTCGPPRRRLVAVHGDTAEDGLRSRGDRGRRRRARPAAGGGDRRRLRLDVL